MSRRFRPTSLTSSAFALFLYLAGGPVLASNLTANAELEVINLQVESISPLPGIPGFSDVEVSAQLQNNDSGTWVSAVVEWRETGASGLEAFGQLRFGALQPLDSAPSTENLTVRVADASLGEVLQLMEDWGFFLVVEAQEETLYTAPVVLLDEATDLVLGAVQASGPGEWLLAFCEVTGLTIDLNVADILLVEKGGYQPVNVDPALLPAHVLDIVFAPSLIDCTQGSEVRITIDTIENLEDLLLSGTVTSGQTSDPVFETTLDDDDYTLLLESCRESEERGEECSKSHPAFPMRWNGLQLGDDIELSGEIMLRASDIGAAISVRNGMVKRVLGTVGLEWTASLQLVAERAATLLDEEQAIFGFGFPVPMQLVPSPGQVVFDLDVVVGASAELAAGAVVGVHQSGAAGVDLAWEVGVGGSAEPWAILDPVGVSPPGLTDASAAQAKAWAGFDVSLLLNGVFGPLVRTRVFSDLQVEPLMDPWWSLGAGVEQEAGLELDFLSVNLQWVAPLWDQRWTLADSNDFPASGSSTPAARGDFLPPRGSGRIVRWANALHDGPGSGSYADIKVTALANGDSLVTGRNFKGFAARIDPEGALLWVKEIGLPVRAAEMPDGNLLIAGRDNDGTIWLQELDAAGDPLGTFVPDLSSSAPISSVEDMAFALGSEPSEPDHCLLVGHTTDSTITERDVIAIRMDRVAGGASPQWSAAWAKAYRYRDVDNSDDEEDSGYGVAATSDGGFAIVGRTDANVGDFWDGNCLAMKIDATGNIEWARTIAGSGGRCFEAVAESAGGNLYAAGKIGHSGVTPNPAMIVASLTPDGATVRRALIAEDAADWLDGGTPTPGDGHLLGPDNAPATAGGDTPHDIALDIAPTSGGLLIAGRTGVSTGSAAWTAKISEELGVAYLRVIDSDEFQELSGIVDTGDGVVAVGSLDEPSTFGDAVLVAKLPYDGGIRFNYENVEFRSKYLQPRVAAANGFSHLVHTPAGGDPVASEEIDFVVEPLSVGQGAAPAPPVDAGFSVTVLASPLLPPATAPPLFASSFETGDLSEWTSSVP